MKNNAKIFDERIINESNKIYKKCYIIFYIFILIDLIIKFNLSNFITKESNYLWFLFGLESLFLVIIFYFNLYSHACKGILIGSSDLSNNRFQFKRYLLISSAVSLIISIGLWGTRLIVYICLGLTGDMPMFVLILFMIILIILTFIILFSILFISFLMAYKVARKKNELELELD